MTPFPPLTYFALALVGDRDTGRESAWRLMRREKGAEFPHGDFRTLREAAREARELQKRTGGILSPMLKSVK